MILNHARSCKFGASGGGPEHAADGGLRVPFVFEWAADCMTFVHLP
jgi:hypothetical protein